MLRFVACKKTLSESETRQATSGTSAATLMGHRLCLIGREGCQVAVAIIVLF